jgi:hypothetical protein
MADMFFAGIPLEGSGTRPLEADLYGAEQQGVDQKNAYLNQYDIILDPIYTTLVCINIYKFQPIYNKFAC